MRSEIFFSMHSFGLSLYFRCIRMPNMFRDTGPPNVGAQKRLMTIQKFGKEKLRFIKTRGGIYVSEDSSTRSNLFPFLLFFGILGGDFRFDVLRNLLVSVVLGRRDEDDFLNGEEDRACLAFSVLASPRTEEEDGKYKEHADKDTDSAAENERNNSTLPSTEMIQCTVKSHHEWSLVAHRLRGSRMDYPA